MPCEMFFRKTMVFATPPSGPTTVVPDSFPSRFRIADFRVFVYGNGKAPRLWARPLHSACDRPSIGYGHDGVATLGRGLANRRYQ